LKTFTVTLWNKNEYTYPMACGFIPSLRGYLHDDTAVRHPCMIVAPGGGYCVVAPTEGEIVARKFYEKGFNAFVLTYTTNLLMNCPVKDQALRDISRAVRIVRSRAEEYGILPDKTVVCGFSAAAHVCASLCVHGQDVREEDAVLRGISNRPDAALLCYPVITTGKYAHEGSVQALLGVETVPGEMDPATGKARCRCTGTPEELEYWSLEKQVTSTCPPCFVWQTATDDCVPVQNSYLFAEALQRAGVPYALHIFTEGHHGLSLANAEWSEGHFGEPYTMAQTFAVMEALRRKTGMQNVPDSPDLSGVPDTALQELEAQFDPSRPSGFAWDPETNRPNAEVAVWPELAQAWMAENLLNVQ
jgi:acetyl esterase/lipase